MSDGGPSKPFQFLPSSHQVDLPLLYPSNVPAFGHLSVSTYVLVGDGLLSRRGV